MRFVNFKQTRAARPSRLGAYLLRRCTQALATRGRHRSGVAVSVDQPGGLCFGPADEADQLDLEAFVAGEAADDRVALERPERHPTDPLD